MNPTKQPLFETRPQQPVVIWIGLALLIFLASVVGIHVEAATPTLVGIIVLYAGWQLQTVWRFLVRLEQEGLRGEAVLWDCYGMGPERILNHAVADRPIVLRVLQEVCLQTQRGRGFHHEGCTDRLRRWLQRQLGDATLAKKTLPSLGLAGTCLGMMGTIRAISIDAEELLDADALTDAVSAALPSMAAAISTTLGAAFLGSFVLAGALHKANEQIEGFVSDLEAQLDIFPFPTDPRRPE